MEPERGTRAVHRSWITGDVGTPGRDAGDPMLVVAEVIAEPVHPADWERMAELVAHYRDLPLGTVDASLVTLLP